ncbi:MAG: cytochrome P450, partial [Pseudomonadales bacterium]
THILKREDIVVKIRAEIEQVFGAGEIDPIRVEELVYLQACIDESQRKKPISVGFNRTLIKNVQLGPLSVPSGVALLPSIYLVQNDPAIWGEDVAVYKPERFLEQKIPLEHFLPFGGGRRRCLGAAFASRQMLIQLAEIIRRCNFDGQQHYQPQFIQSGQAVDLKEPFTVTVERIDDA